MGAFRRIANLFRLGRLHREIDAELESHVEMRTEENLAQGMTPEEARRDALVRFGSRAAMHERVTEQDASLPLETFFRNVRFALRQLRRSPGFAMTAVLALALGIGPNVAIFSMIYATFLAPPPYPNANQLVVVWRHLKGERIPTQGDEVAELMAQSRSFQGLSFESWISLHLTNSDHTPDPETGLAFSPGLQTRTVRTPLLMGRDFLPDEGGPGRDHVVILTNWLWRHRYYSDPNILGKSILIEDSPYTVVGVMRATPHETGGGVEFSVPVQLNASSKSQFGIMIGRLKPGVSLAQAQAELSAIDQRFAEQHYGVHGTSPITLTVEHFRNDWLDVKTQRNLWLLFYAVGLVLLIACANIANLLLARGATRMQELAVRSALGASRGQIFAQLLTESLTLSIFGGAIGVALGWVLMKLCVAYLPNLALESTDTLVQMNLPVLAFAMAAAVFAGVVAGCAPGWRSMRINQSEALKEGSRATGGRGRTPLQSVLVSAEIALALILLAGAGLAMHSFWNLSHIDIGFEPEHVLTADLRPEPGSRPARLWSSPQQVVAQQQALLERVRQIPGVGGAAMATGLPMEEGSNFRFAIAGQPVDRAHMLTADFEAVTPSFFRTFGVRLDRGRFLSDQDTLQSPPVVVVNETFVRRYLGKSDPLDQRLQVLLPMFFQEGTKPKQPAPVDCQIVGVFHDILNRGHLTGEVLPEMYFSYWQVPFPSGAIAVRTVGADPASVTNALQHAVNSVRPGTAMDHVQPMEQVISMDSSDDRFEMLLFGAFAAVALLLAGVGIYGVMSFAVAQRTHEIGVRMALGARRSDVVRLIVTNGMRMAVAGLVLGVAGAVGLGRLMHSTLYGVKTVDALSLAGVAVLLSGVALLACWFPARRSAQVDPMRALRNE
ncbi:MAG: ADOP family duplicated permease [Acidobacteriota bacterium]